jgi:hypothetical protein
MYVSCYPPVPKLHECFILLIYLSSFLVSVMAAMLIHFSGLKVCFKDILFISHSLQQAYHLFIFTISQSH